MAIKDESKAAGGIARAAALSSEDKRKIARKGALARWGVKATHKGNFEAEFGIDVDCYVLDDPDKTAVISQRGMGTALGMGTIGSRLPRLVSRKSLSNYIGPELRVKLDNPIIFQGAISDQNRTRFHGYDVTILIDLCKAILAAQGAGKKINPAVVKQAHIIISASAKAGIRGLVYALSGYDATKQEVIEAFKQYVRKEAREYEKEFPDQLYAEWYRLYKLPQQQNSKPWKFKHLTLGHIYEPLAKSRGKILELTKAQRDASDERWKKLHQFLSEVGVKALRTQLGQTLGIAQISDTKEEYEANILKAFGGQPDLFRK